MKKLNLEVIVKVVSISIIVLLGAIVLIDAVTNGSNIL